MYRNDFHPRQFEYTISGEPPLHFFTMAGLRLFRVIVQFVKLVQKP